MRSYTPDLPNMFTLYSAISTPREFENLGYLLKSAFRASRSGGVDVLERVEKDGHPYLNSEQLRASIDRLEVYEKRADAYEPSVDSFQTAINKVAQEIEDHKRGEANPAKK